MPSDRLNYRVVRQFFPFQVPLTGFSPQKQLQQQLLALLTKSEEALPLQGRVSLTAASVLNVSLPKAIAITRMPQTNIIYRSAIAFQLSSLLSLAPIALAEMIFSTLVTICTAEDNFPQLSFTAHLIVPGWIDFHLSDRSLALWLQHFPQQLASQDLLALKSKKSVNPAQIWLLNHTHARCCSLLRLGQQEKLIKLKATTWEWEIPHPVPYLSENSGKIELRLLHPAERSLVSQIFITVDCLENSQTANWIQLASNLSQAFWNFERDCRIFGEIAQSTPEISQARLGLLAIVQMLLQKMYSEGTNSLLLAQL